MKVGRRNSHNCFAASCRDDNSNIAMGSDNDHLSSEEVELALGLDFRSAPVVGGLSARLRP